MGVGTCRHMRRSSALELNRRFAMGTPSDNLDSAGVVLRAFEMPLFTPDFVHRGTHRDGVLSASLVSARVPYLYTGGALKSDGRSLMGIVLAPRAVHASLLCSYPRDAQTHFVRCNASAAAAGACVPGCVGLRIAPRANSENRWCDQRSVQDRAYGTEGLAFAPPPSCAWPSSRLSTSMAIHEQWTTRALTGCHSRTRHNTSREAAALWSWSQHYYPRSWCGCILRAPSRWPCCDFPQCPLYNELVLNASVLEELMRAAKAGVGIHPVEAVYFVSPGGGPANGWAERAARALHRALRVQLPSAPPRDEVDGPCSVGSDAHQPSGPILVALDLTGSIEGAAPDSHQPFRLVEDGW